MVPIIELLVVLGFFTTVIGIVLPTITAPLMAGNRRDIKNDDSIHYPTIGNFLG